MTQHVLANPMALVETQAQFWQDYLTLWQRTTQRLLLGQEAQPVIEPPRTTGASGTRHGEDPVFDFIKQSYLLSARCLQRHAARVRGPRRGHEGARSSSTPASWSTRSRPATSPTPTRKWSPPPLESGGGNLVKGLENLLDDLERGRASSRSG